MLIRANLQKIQASQYGWIWDYPMPSQDVGISYQEYNGKAPDRGWWRNKTCWESYFVVSGTATVYVDAEIHEVKNGDVIVVLPGQKTRLEARDLKIITITKPNWTADQSEIVEG